MPAECQKAVGYTLVGLQKTIYFVLDDLIMVSAGSDSDHINYVIKCLRKLNQDNLRINLQKCQFAKTEIGWLCHKFDQKSILPLERKTAVNLAIPSVTTLKRLRSFPGSLHYIHTKFSTTLPPPQTTLKKLLNMAGLRHIADIFIQLKIK